jgi:hypothetical protein
MAFSKALPFVTMLLVVLPMVAMADIDGNLTAFYGTQHSLSCTFMHTQARVKSWMYDLFFVNCRQVV